MMDEVYFTVPCSVPATQGAGTQPPPGDTAPVWLPSTRPPQPALLTWRLLRPLQPWLSVPGAAQGPGAPSDPQRKGPFTQVQSLLFLGQRCFVARHWVWALFAYNQHHRGRECLGPHLPKSA